MIYTVFCLFSFIYFICPKTNFSLALRICDLLSLLFHNLVFAFLGVVVICSDIDNCTSGINKITANIIADFRLKWFPRETFVQRYYEVLVV